MKKSRKALLSSALSLLLCFTMLLGTTYAWFTDSVTSTNNIIKAGNLDIELEYWDKGAGKWEPVKEDTPLFEESTLWEPGYTQVVYLRAANKGTLALKYQLGINIVDEKSGIRVDENGNEVSFKLSDSIYMGVAENVNGETGAYATREAAVEAVKNASGIISTGFNKYGDMDAGAAEQYLAVVVYMPESVGNEANHKTGTEAPKITLGIQLLATQKSNEEDSFGSDYDAAAKHPYGDVNYTAAKAISAEQISTDGALTEAVTVGNESDGIYAEVPEGVKMADGVTELALTVQAMDENASEAVVTLDSGESKQSLNIHVDGVAEDNDTPMLITLEGLFDKGLNTTSVAMYHVEDGVTVPMELVTDPTDHNQFSYDPATGNVILCVKSFSEYVAVTDNLNPWEGTAASGFNGGTGTAEEPYVIATAEQLAYFGLCVDNGNKFEDEYIVLNNDIDLGGTISFNPIGCGYAPATGVTNSNNVTGAPFMGTFNGQGNTIYGLYQNGWELGLSYCNLGGGLFASIADGTVKNLTISGAHIVMECVEMGILVGLSQGSCTYENINIYSSEIANYQRATGGLIGEISPIDSTADAPETTTIKDVTIGSDVVVGSLWGDFDTPVGGVIGARWDDDDTTTVTMTDVTVACELDVYNDVTSTYQWYAYRRAGMLIGNTDQPAADGKNSKTAAADFLTCKQDSNGNDTVIVYYGDWVKYHYCQFSNYKTNWPWVRVEAGENCEAYSNPRYGVPNDVNGNRVVDANHTHLDGDECNVLIAFGQLYGGGQGVYGQTEHVGVTVESYAYTIQYINDNEVLAETPVPSNESKFVLAENDKTTYDAVGTAVEDWLLGQGYTEEDIEFGGWVNAGSTKVTEIPAGNTENIKLYPYFNSPYTARFVDQSGNVLAWCLFHSEKTTELETTRELAETKVPTINNFDFDSWEVHVTDDEGNTTTKESYNIDKFTSYTSDVTIYPVYIYTDKTLSLHPVDSDGDGDTDYYQVDGSEISAEKTDFVIPEDVNGIPVIEIVTGAFADGELRDVIIPHSIETIGANAFCADNWREYPQIQIIFDGTKAEWDALNKTDNWDDNIGANSNIVCLRELEAGYYNMKPTTIIQNPPSGWEWITGSYPAWFIERYPTLVPTT